MFAGVKKAYLGLGSIPAFKYKTSEVRIDPATASPKRRNLDVQSTPLMFNN